MFLGHQLKFVKFICANDRIYFALEAKVNRKKSWVTMRSPDDLVTNVNLDRVGCFEYYEIPEKNFWEQLKKLSAPVTENQNTPPSGENAKS